MPKHNQIRLFGAQIDSQTESNDLELVGLRRYQEHVLLLSRGRMQIRGPSGIHHVQQ